MTVNTKPVIILRKMAETVPYLIPWLEDLAQDTKQFDKRGRGVSGNYLYKLIYYNREPKPGGRVEEILIKLLQSLKQKSPLEEGKKEKARVGR